MSALTLRRLEVGEGPLRKDEHLQIRFIVRKYGWRFGCLRHCNTHRYFSAVSARYTSL